MRVLIILLLLFLLTAADCVSLCDRYPGGADHFIRNGTPYGIEMTVVVPLYGNDANGNTVFIESDTIGPFDLERGNSARFFRSNNGNWEVAVFNGVQQRGNRLSNTHIERFSPIYIRYSNGRCDTLNKKGSEVTHPIFYDFNLGNVRFNEGLTDWEIYDPFPDRDCDKTIEYTYVFSEAFYNRSAPCNAVSGSGLSGSGLSGSGVSGG